MAMRWATKNLISAVDGKAKAALLQGPFLRSPFKFYVRNLCDRMAAADVDVDVDAPPPPTHNWRTWDFLKSSVSLLESTLIRHMVLPPGDQIVLECAQFAVQQRNDDLEDAQFKLVDVWRAKFGGSKFTMTIVASDASGSVNQFIVKVWCRPWMEPKPMELRFWRRVPVSQMLSQKEEIWDLLSDEIYDEW